jgi:hypothetical protein
MNYKSALCSCVVCHQTKSAKGIFSHYITAHTEEGIARAVARGKKGGENSKEYSAKLRNDNISAYLENPSMCKQCYSIIPYDIKGNTFCNHSCAAKHHNLLRHNKETKISEFSTARQLTYKCLHCDTDCRQIRGNSNKYCSISCQQEYILNQRVANKTASSKTLKRYLIKKRGYKCWECGLEEWRNKPIVLELEHNDGNSDNNDLENLSLLCPNCHSQTPTYKAKNKGNGRHYRRQRYAEGKSF